jgi:hypothetical protein
MHRQFGRYLAVAGFAVAWTLAGPAHFAEAAGWKAGTARVAITPRQPTWMAGYGGRTKPSEGAEHDLWAKALVLEDGNGKKAALVTLDICGIGQPLSNEVRDALKSQLGLEREQVVLACSHTHCGPVVGSNLITMYPLDDEQRGRVEEYARFLSRSIVDTVAKAAADLRPAELSWGTGRADFAVNRRNNKEGEVPRLRERLALQGPIDHDVPVLQVKGPGGRPLAIVFGYACHCTVLSYYKFCGDYAGFAQLAIEKNNPGAQAMFVAGCGGDQNPIPRRTVELAQAYGNQLAQSVQRVLETPMTPISGPLAADYTEIRLEYGELPSRDQIEADAKSKTLAVANRAKMLLQTIDRQGQLNKDYPYPVQAWRLDDLHWVFLGGEVVVDYSLRIKRNLGSSHTWVSAYCNDVCAYMPSLRVLKEGGYEGETSMIYYGHPTKWSEKIEEEIIGAVDRVVRTTDAGH